MLIGGAAHLAPLGSARARGPSFFQYSTPNYSSESFPLLLPSLSYCSLPSMLHTTYFFYLITLFFSLFFLLLFNAGHSKLMFFILG